MISDAETSPQALCTATTKAGAPCRKLAFTDGLCVFHSGAIDLAEPGRRGGRAHGRKKEEHAGERLEARAYAALGELLDSGSATARTQAVRYTLDRLTANSPAGLEVAKHALWLDMQEQTKQQMPAARAKLARLIESRAKEMADEMTEAKLAELVEQRATEKAQALYIERMRVEMEAVKAELSEPPAGQVDLEELIREEERTRQRRELEGP